MRRVFILVVLLIVYGSLYPWGIVDRHIPGGPVWYLLHQWDSWLNPYLIRDVFVNTVLYFPLGLTGYLCFRRYVEAPSAWLVSFGFILSFSIETAQAYVPPRLPSMVDVFFNTGGTLLGVLAGRLVGNPGWLRTNRHFADRRAAVLVAGWLIWLLFPFVPLHSRTMIDLKVDEFFRSAYVTPSILWFIAMWYAAGLLMQAAGIRFARVWLALSLALIPAEVFLRDRMPLLSELGGAAAGWALFAIRPRLARVRDWEAWGFLLLTVAGGVSAPRFPGQPPGFSLVPFESFIRMDGPTGLRILLSQLLAFGAAIWLLNAAGRRTWQAVVVVAGVAMLAQLATIFVPGAAPGFTAPLLAVLAGVVLEATQAHQVPVSEPQTVA